MKKALIIFPDEWISYSPTVLNFIDCFKLIKFEVIVFAFDDGSFENKFSCEGIEYIKIHPFISRVLRKVRLYKILKVFLILCRLIGIKKKYNHFDVVLAVDYLGFIPARILFSKTILLSLEATKNIFLNIVKLFKRDCLIIQTEERKDYLFGQSFNKVYYIQNSPRIVTPLKKEKHNGKRLILLGNLVAEHGVQECIESLALLEGYTLLLKGPISKTYLEYISDKYKNLILNKKISFDPTYIEQNNILSFLSEFDIGFCLYNMKLISEQDFNYISCPSGKLFNYFAAGIPVIGSNILGLKSIRQYNAGVLTNTLSPESIIKAIKEIDGNYKEYSENSYRAGNDFDFNKAFDVFIKDYFR